MFSKKSFYWLWLVALVTAPIILWFLPSTTFDSDQFPFCPSRVLFDIECMGCGMTRAAMHFHHFEFEDAIFYNTGIVLVYPLLVWMWVKWINQATIGIGLRKK